MFRLIHDGEIARLTLDRPEARNAIPGAGWDELAERIDEAAASAARLLLISGADDTFCAGADLGDFKAMRGDEAACVRFRERMRAALERLRELAIPTVARIDGPCYGAGVALAMACDLRVASRNARFAITPAKIGISYPQEDVHRLVELVGPGQAARFLFTAQGVDGIEAYAIGLVELLEPDGGADAVAAAILGNSSESLAALKRAIRLAVGGCRSDAGQDTRFDTLIGGEELALRLEALRRK